LRNRNVPINHFLSCRLFRADAGRRKVYKCIATFKVMRSNGIKVNV
jgi:hypothetical protein